MDSRVLNDICSIKAGYTPRETELFDVGDYPYFKVGDMNNQGNEKYLCVAKSFLKAPCKSFPKGSIVFPKNGAAIGTNKKRILFQPSIVDLNTAVLIPNDDQIPEFLLYWISHIDFREITRRGAIPTLDIAELKQKTIPYNSRAEQERIVAELDLLTEIIDKQKAQLKELDTLAQSIFYDMFGDPVENEKGWDIREMGELYEIGSSKRVFEAQWTNTGVPFYRAREIVRISKNEPIDSPIYITEQLYQEYSNRYGVPSEGDIMITAVGTLGVSYIVKKNDKFYFKDGNILWFKSKGLCEPRFIKDEYSTSYVVNQIQGNANAAVVGTYTIMNAKKTKVFVPPIALQKEYVKKVEKIEQQKATISQSIAETQKLFDYTMDKYFG